MYNWVIRLMEETAAELGIPPRDMLEAALKAGLRMTHKEMETNANADRGAGQGGPPERD